MPGLLTFLLVVGYVGGAWKFWTGYHRTTFGRSLGNKLALSLLWPALWIANKSYRQNFNKTLKGS